MAFKEQLLANLDSATHADLKTFLEDCGVTYLKENNQIVITGPEVPPLAVKNMHDIIMAAVANTEEVTSKPDIYVSAGGNQALINWIDYEKSAADLVATHNDPAQNIAEMMALNGVPEASFMPPTENDGSVDSAALAIEDTSQKMDIAVEERDGVSGMTFNKPEGNIKPEEDLDDKPSQAPQEYRQAGIADLISNGARMFALPITAPLRVAGQQIKALNGWRDSRPQRMIDRANDEANKLELNLASFRTDAYDQIEAKVKSRGGWDVESTAEFNDYLDNNNLRPGWNMIRSQMQNFQEFGKKAIQYSGDNISSVSQSLDERASKLSKVAGRIPYAIKNGEVTATLEEAAKAMREMIARLIEKLTALIVKRPSSAPSV